MANGNSRDANMALVTRMYECFNRDDMETIRREIFSPNLIWNLPGHHPLAGTKNGPDEVLAFFAALRRAISKSPSIPRPTRPPASIPSATARWSRSTAAEARSR